MLASHRIDKSHRLKQQHGDRQLLIMINDLQKAASAAERFAAKALEGTGVSPRHYVMLAAIDSGPGISSLDLQTIVGSSRSLFSMDCKALEKRGLLKRKLAEDNRLRQFWLTAKGAAKVAAIAERYRAADAAVEDVVPSGNRVAVRNALSLIIQVE